MLKSERTKQQILDTAISLFKAKGIQNTSIDEIVKKTALGKGTFFYHFSNKDTIVFDIINKAFDGYFVDPEQISANQELRADVKLEKVMKSLFSALSPPVDIAQIFQHGISIQYEKYINDLRLSKLIPLITQIINQGKKESIFDVRNVDALSSIICIGISGYIHNYFSKQETPDDFRNVLAGIEELVNNALCTKQKIKISL